jgi:hypothetical protein
MRMSTSLKSKVSVHDLALIEQHMKARLPRAAMTRRDLRNAALARVDHAQALLGPVRIERLSYVTPVWRPLVWQIG